MTQDNFFKVGPMWDPNLESVSSKIVTDLELEERSYLTETPNPEIPDWTLH